MSLFSSLMRFASKPAVRKTALLGGAGMGSVAAGMGLNSALSSSSTQPQIQKPEPKPKPKPESDFKKTLNTQAPRTNVNPKLLKSFSDRILTMEDDTSQGYSTNLKPNTFIKKFLPNYANEYIDKRFTTLNDDLERGKEPVHDVLSRFEGKGIERQDIPGNEKINAKLDPDDFRAEVLGGTDLAKRVVYWSGNNVLHNRYDNLSKSSKDSYPKMLKEYGVTVPHRTSITLNTLNTLPGFNKPNPSIDYNLVHGNPETNSLMTDFLNNGTADIALDDPESVGHWNGFHTNIDQREGGRNVPAIRLKNGDVPLYPWEADTITLNDYVAGNTKGEYKDKSDHYGLDGIGGKGLRFINPGGILGTEFHEANHHEAGTTDFKYGAGGDPGIHNLGFENKDAYAGSSRAELTRAMQSGKLPVTKMLMDKVERLAPELIPDYNKMSPEVQLDTKAQIIAQLAEDPNLALVTLKRWGAFDPDRPDREQGLAYNIPKSYLTGDTSINAEIVNALVGLNRSVIPDKSENPLWRQYWNLTYPQLIARNEQRNRTNRIDRNNIV